MHAEGNITSRYALSAIHFGSENLLLNRILLTDISSHFTFLRENVLKLKTKIYFPISPWKYAL